MSEALPYEDWLSFSRYGQWTKAEADLLVADRPCFIFGYIAVIKKSGEQYSYLHDSTSKSSTLRYDIFAYDAVPVSEGFWPPLYFNKGLYVEFGTDYKYIIVRYMIDPRA